MDLFDDIFNDQLLQFSPLRFSPSPEPFTPLTDFLPDPLVDGTENVDEEAVGLINNPAINEANLSMGPLSPNLVPLPGTLTLVQNPPEMDQQQLLCNSQGDLQEDVSNRQSDQQFLPNQSMLDSFQESDVFAMPYQPLLCNSHGYLQGNLTNGQLDQQSLFNQNMINPFQEPNDYTMIEHGQQIKGENSGYAHPTLTQSFDLPNHLQEQFLSLPLSQNYPSNSTYQHGLVASHFNMYDQQPLPLVLPNRERMVTNMPRTNLLPNQIPIISRLSQIISSSTRFSYRTNPLRNQISETHFLPQMSSNSTRENPLPNQISVTPPFSQISSSSTRTYPLFNQISVTSSLPQIQSNSIRKNPLPNQILETSPLPQMSSNSTRTNPLPNQISVTPHLPQMPSSSIRTNSLLNQISVTPHLPQMLLSSTRINPLLNQISVTHPLPQMSSYSTRNQGDVQEGGNQPSRGVGYPTLETYAREQGLPCTKAFAPIDFNVLGRRQRNDQSCSERGESSSAAQRRRIVVPERNFNLSAVNNGQERLQNTLYSPLYETLGLRIDPHLRNFAKLPLLPKKLG